MLTPEKCPFCGSSKVLAGKVTTSSGGYGFRPLQTRKGLVFTLRTPFAFKFGPEACYCVKCCMVWSKADGEDATEFLQKFSDENLKARLAAQEAQSAPPPQSQAPIS